MLGSEPGGEGSSPSSGSATGCREEGHPACFGNRRPHVRIVPTGLIEGLALRRETCYVPSRVGPEGRSVIPAEDEVAGSNPVSIFGSSSSVARARKHRSPHYVRAFLVPLRRHPVGPIQNCSRLVRAPGNRRSRVQSPPSSSDGEAHSRFRAPRPRGTLFVPLRQEGNEWEGRIEFTRYHQPITLKRSRVSGTTSPTSDSFPPRERAERVPVIIGSNPISGASCPSWQIGLPPGSHNHAPRALSELALPYLDTIR